jgi:hypothetical protein
MKKFKDYVEMIDTGGQNLGNQTILGLASSTKMPKVQTVRLALEIAESKEVQDLVRPENRIQSMVCLETARRWSTIQGRQ